MFIQLVNKYSLQGEEDRGGGLKIGKKVFQKQERVREGEGGRKKKESKKKKKKKH